MRETETITIWKYRNNLVYEKRSMKEINLASTTVHISERLSLKLKLGLRKHALYIIHLSIYLYSIICI